MHDLKTTVASRTLMRNYIAEMVEADSGWSDQNRDQGWLLDDVDELERQLAAAYSALGLQRRRNAKRGGAGDE